MASNYEPIDSQSTQPKLTPLQGASISWNTFKHHIPRMMVTILIDVFLPLIIYFILEHKVQPFYALFIASSPPLVMIIVKALWERSFDAVGFLVSAAFILAAILALLFQNPTILLIEKSFLTSAGAILFSLTLIPCQVGRFQWRPMVYYFYFDLLPVTREEYGLPVSLFEKSEKTRLEEKNQKSARSNGREVAEIYAWIYDHCPSFRATCYFMTAVWAISFAIECVVRYLLITWQFPINLIFIYGQILFVAIVIICATLQICSMLIERKHTIAYIEQWKHDNLQKDQQ